MNVDKTLEEIKQHTAAITELRRTVAEKEQAIAAHLCPFDEGERVLNAEGETEIVTLIRFTGFRDMYAFSVFKLKKDGALHKCSRRVYHPEGYKKLGGES